MFQTSSMLVILKAFSCSPLRRSANCHIWSILRLICSLEYDLPFQDRLSGYRTSQVDRPRLPRSDIARAKLKRHASGSTAPTSTPGVPPPNEASSQPPPPPQKQQKSKKLSARATKEFLRTEMPNMLQDVLPTIIRRELPDILRDIMPEVLRELLPEVVGQRKGCESADPSRETKGPCGPSSHSPERTSDFAYGDIRFPIADDIFVPPPLEAPPTAMLEKQGETTDQQVELAEGTGGDGDLIVYKRKKNVGMIDEPGPGADYYLSLSDDQIVEKIKNLDPRQLVMELNGYKLSKGHLDGLLGENELGNFVFDLGCDIFNIEWNGPVRKHIVDVFTTNNICSFDGKSSTRKKIKFSEEIKKIDLLIFPLCENHHWRGIAINFPEKSATLLDSLPSKRRSLEFFENLKIVLKELHPKAKDGFDIEELSVADLPEQTNGVDCGVYLLQFIEQWGATDNVVIEDGYRAKFLRRLFTAQKEKLGKQKRTTKYAQELAKYTSSLNIDSALPKRQSKSVHLFSPSEGHTKTRPAKRRK